MNELTEAIKMEEKPSRKLKSAVSSQQAHTAELIDDDISDGVNLKAPLSSTNTKSELQKKKRTPAFI